ncbi:MAG TPA: 50S ribosomal protein L19 [Polyangiales bacterium]|nr:50S ribosomal protein L19 [Polyangiales bacterium]
MPSTISQLTAIEQPQVRDLPDFRVGDTVKVHFRISEGEKDRIQVFQGTVIRKSSGGVGATFAVRKTSYGVGVERIFPLNSPRIEQVEIGFRGRVRQARLYYMRELEGKKARLRESTRARITTKVAPPKSPSKKPKA